MAVVQVDPNNFTLQVYNSQDENLISSTDIDTVLTGSSYIEFFIYENNSTLSFQNYSYINYSVENDSPSTGLNAISQFNIDPESDCQTQGFDRGDNIAYYNFLTKEIGDVNQKLFISEISSDRTEVRLDSNVLDNISIFEQTNNFIQKRKDSDYFLDFYLNFGNNDLLISNNIKLDNESITDPTVLVKLYEPLPPEFDLKSELWVVTTLNEPEAFRVTFPNQVIDFDDTIQLQGPNLNLPIKGQINNSTQNLSYNDLIASNTTSSFQQLKSLIASSSLQISIDYSDFDDFIHFSSAKTRLENFYYKVGLIEGYSASISDLTGISSSATSVNILEDKIGKVKQNFDGFEYYLYYSSGSTTWPKTTSIQPYKLSTTGSTDVLTWLGSDNEGSAYYGGQILSASNFDNQNPDNLLFSIPEYLREDAANEPYDLFVSMVGQNFDDIWVYTKDITQKYNADNRLDYGVSKDLVAEAIRDFGIKLYQNNFSKDDLYTAFLGMTPNGALFPFPDITGSLPVPTGYEYVNTMISASTTPMPLDDVNKSIYKRIYHNLPYLIQSKGTIPGLRALITSYGIPDTILKISEFGGKDKTNTDDWDYYFNKFNYAFDTGFKPGVLKTNPIETKWFHLESEWDVVDQTPGTVAFRFKPENFPPTDLSQSLWSLTNLSNQPFTDLTLEYGGSGSLSGSYSASIKDPYYQYANLKFYPSSSNTSLYANLYLPFFDGNWWSVMVTSGSNGYNLTAKNKIYNGKDGTSIGYQSSSIVTLTSGTDVWNLRRRSIFVSQSLFPGFSGSLQEIRYYTRPLSESRFDDFVMNPLSIEGNSINSSPNDLIFRASLGSELDNTPAITGTSIHPKVTGSWEVTQSFSTGGGNSNFDFHYTSSYLPNTEYYFLDQPAVGIKNRITDKVRFENNVIPTGDTLSPFRRVTQQTEASASYTPHINLLEVAFSPQNEINDDIIGQLGYFNVGDYIGDPRQRSSSLDYYPDLNELRDAYFEKYIKNYDLVDFIRLIKFFDNSLFRMVKDFIPARTSLASGLVIKQHLLERNKYPQPQLDINTEIAKYPKSGSIIYNEPIIEQDLALLGTVAPQWNDYNSGSIGNLTGGAGGSVNSINYPPKPIKFGFTSSGYPTINFTSSDYAGDANDAGSDVGGLSTWVNPALAEEAPNGSGTNSSGSNTLTNYLDVTDFTFNVPSNALNIGVQAMVYKKYSNANPDPLGWPTLTDETIQLLHNGSVIGSNKADTSTNWPTSFTAVKYNSGHIPGYWTASLTPTILNSTTFGLRIQADIPENSYGSTASIDAVSMSVSYGIGDANDLVKINSDVRGVLESIVPPTGSSNFTSSFHELYDGENIYTTFETDASPSIRGLSWETTHDIVSKYHLSHSLSSFTASNDLGIIYPFSGSTPISTGDKVRWQTNDLGQYAIRYMPIVNPMLTFGSYYPSTHAQQWQYANSTLSGSIFQTQKSQDEFYNGEYSGSVLLVSNGELNSDCDVFKNVSTEEASYAVRYYVDNVDDLSTWLNVNNRPLNGFISIIASIYTNKVYVRVAKIDNNNKNRSVTLSSLTEITILDSATNNPTYKVINRTEYPNYYSYEITDSGGLPTSTSHPEFDFTGSTSTGVGSYIKGMFTQSFDSTTDVSTVPNLIYTPDDTRIFKGNYFNPVGMNFTIPTYFQKDFIVSMSADITASNTDTSVSKSLFTFYRSDVSPAQILTATQNQSDSVYTSSISASFIVSASQFPPGISIGFVLGSNSNSTPFITASINNFVLTLKTSGSVSQTYYGSILDPDFGNNNWDRSLDCHAILNNAEDNRLNPFLQDVDYNTGQIVPTNITAIISESATKAAIPESNYTSLKVINPRYLGTKNQSEKVNQWTPSGSWGNNIGTYGKTPSISSLSNKIYEFDFINAAAYPNQDTTPYLPQVGTIHMRKIYEVATPESVKTVNPLGSSKIIHTTRPTQMTGSISTTVGFDNFEFSSSYNKVTQSVNDFYYALNNDLKVNTPIQITQYSPDTNAVSPVTTKVLATGFSKTKGRNAYVITSSLGSSNYIALWGKDSNTILFKNASQKLYLNSNIGGTGESEYGDYSQGPFFNTVHALASGSNGIDTYGNESSIKVSLKQGNRWFITLFSELTGSSFSPNNVYPYNKGFDGVDEDGNLEYPLQYHGVHEILAFESGSGIGLAGGRIVMVVDSISQYNIILGGTSTGFEPAGAIIWKAELDEGLVLTQDNVYNVDKGAFTTSYPISDITNNFDQITRDFGANST